MKRSPIRRGTTELMRRVPLRNKGTKQRRDAIEMKAAEPFMGPKICKMQLMARDGHVAAKHTCFGRLVRHHVLPRNVPGSTNDASNLIWLCITAHDWVHNVDPKTARALGLLR